MAIKRQQLINVVNAKRPPYLIRIVFVLLFCCCKSTLASNAAPMTFGKTYPIIEEDLLAYIQFRAGEMVKSGEWQRKQEQALLSIKQKIIRPEPVALITRTKEERTWVYDPSIRVPFDLKDLDGKVFARKGEIVNPLNVVTLKNTLVFFDGDDQEQVAYVKKTIIDKDQHVKLILVSGEIQKTSQTFNMPIYFDQKGLLTTKFGIQHVPAIVQQKALHLTITEVMP